MNLTVVFRQTALRNLARMRSEDKDLFARTRRTVALLADEPYPAGAVAWGATGIYRLLPRLAPVPMPEIDESELARGQVNSCLRTIRGEPPR